MHAKPKYVYQKRQVLRDGAKCLVDHCVCVLPKPQKVTDEKCKHCPDWRDAAGRDAETVRKLVEAEAYEEGV